MKLKYDFLISTVAGRTIAVPDKTENFEFNGYLVLNKTGKIIFEALKNDMEFEKIIHLLQENFPDATQEEIKESATVFLQKLHSEDLLI